MIARRVACCTLRRQTNRVVCRTRTSRRKLSSAPSASPQSPTTNPFVGLTTELDRIAPRFDIEASQIDVLDSPSSFYETLKRKILSARQRIYLSTLYIGKTEHDLIATLHEALRTNSELKVSILTDALRGTRETPEPSCASLLSDLIVQHGSDRVEIRMFHTPNLTGLRKRFIPKRINEGWGLQHMKLYGFDDEIMLSGANLSNDYFTNRLDRYHVFSSKRLSDFYERIHNAVCSISYRVLPDAHSSAGYLLDWPSANGCPSPLEDPTAFKSHSRKLLEPLYLPSAPPQPTSSFSADLPTPSSQSKSRKAHVYPLAQFTPLYKTSPFSSSLPDPSTEYPSLIRLLSHLTSPTTPPSLWTFTAGYFNIHPHISRLLIKSASPSPSSTPSSSPLNPPRPPKTLHGTVLTASPFANGFYNSPGISSMLPAAYTHLARRFLDRVHVAGADNHITLKEWRRGTVGEPRGWTYHAKGIWVTFPKSHGRGRDTQDGVAGAGDGDEEGPSITVVGSSNYTKRSYSLDLEVGALVVTEDQGLKAKLKKEVEGLERDARAVKSREELGRVPWSVRVAMWVVGVVGGAL